MSEMRPLLPRSDRALVEKDQVLEGRVGTLTLYPPATDVPLDEEYCRLSGVEAVLPLQKCPKAQNGRGGVGEGSVQSVPLYVIFVGQLRRLFKWNSLELNKS